MDQLLQINTVPIKIDVTVNRAKLQYNSDAPKVQVSRDKGGLKLQAQPIKINIDNQKMRDSINMKSPDKVTQDYADKGIKISYQATAKIVQDGNQLVDAQHISPAQLAAQQNSRSIETILSFLPSDGPDISWSGGTLNINYTADQLNFDWDTNPMAGFEFIPGSIEFVIKEMPHVDIEYVGEPLYVPASANPNYVEPDLNVMA